jgi:hypothetical protein
MSTGGLVHEQRWINGSSEWYTPPHVFDLVGIEFDLDPADSPGGVPWISRRRHFAQADDGLTGPWHGRVWLNRHTVARPPAWLGHLAEHGDGIALAFAPSNTAWAGPSRTAGRAARCIRPKRPLLACSTCAHASKMRVRHLRIRK